MFSGRGVFSGTSEVPPRKKTLRPGSISCLGDGARTDLRACPPRCGNVYTVEQFHPLLCVFMCVCVIKTSNIQRQE